GAAGGDPAGGARASSAPAPQDGGDARARGAHAQVGRALQSPPARAARAGAPERAIHRRGARDEPRGVVRERAPRLDRPREEEPARAPQDRQDAVLRGRGRTVESLEEALAVVSKHVVHSSGSVWRSVVCRLDYRAVVRDCSARAIETMRDASASTKNTAQRRPTRAASSG